MIITGMLFLLGLSSEISERKMILYISTFPFLTFIITSVYIISGASLRVAQVFTIISLIILFLVILIVIIDVAIMEGKISKFFDEFITPNNSNDTMFHQKDNNSNEMIETNNITRVIDL
jgi:uncharacterized membrane protein